MKIIECVPNISEGSNEEIIAELAALVRSFQGVKLLHIDSGKAANRTVFTFAGEAHIIAEAAFAFIQKATELIDMRFHVGEHPRIGAVDVFPMIPISGISLEETAQYARRLAKRVGEELQYPVYCYEAAAAKPERQKLEYIRSGEYEGLSEKIKRPDFQPDFGPTKWIAKHGASVIGARKFLIAYNVNLRTKSVAIAKQIAAQVRESGSLQLINGQEIRIPGRCKSVKAIGWYIEEYGCAQVSLNITDLDICPVHVAFEEVCKAAEKYGTVVTGSELIGLAPLRVFEETANFYKQFLHIADSLKAEESVKFTTACLGLDDLNPNFEPFERVVEFLL
jgi:glutamate formiminotransferase / formiminotetrahydrofolate cyclodeaminase